MESGQRQALGSMLLMMIDGFSENLYSFNGTSEIEIVINMLLT